ncbi:MAG: hypothetical protein CVU09_00460 [Bacteroidetes bacterium HGW-Bacteroidetes-4]|jgi:hypothetical protein|nr:MAG: hypothetical protein CVU09_00460 [Bacteroidetes bacterium HGW-Bacteroidetes-4]
MFRLTFSRNSSKYFEKAVEIVRGLGGTLNGDVAVLEIPEYELLEAYQKLVPLLVLVQKWKGLKAWYNNKEVKAFDFLFNAWRNIGECAKRKIEFGNSIYCWPDIDIEEWGCHRLTSVPGRMLRGTGNFERNGRYWYNLGAFESQTIWKVDKEQLFAVLKNRAEHSGVSLCPFFSIERIKEIIDKLPTIIMVDGIHFRYYIPPGESHPTNIRHIPKEQSIISTPVGASYSVTAELHYIGQNIQPLKKAFEKGMGRN